MDRKLASCRKIEEIKPIEGADRICSYRVGGWWVVDGIGKYKVGNLAIYFEIDSLLPVKPEYEFLRKNCLKIIDGVEKFKLKTIKLKKQVSQGLLIPLPFKSFEGEDLTDKLGITKWEPPIHASLAGMVRGNFPLFIVKTDEERIQNLDRNIGGEKVYITEKLDGSSSTFYFNDGLFGVCSRNIDLKDTEDNSFWNMARKYNLQYQMTNYAKNICLQGELIGPGVQGNPYGLKELDVRFFTAFDIDKQRRMSKEELLGLATLFSLPTVPMLHDSYVLPTENLIEYMLNFAEGKSVLNPNTEREGVVFRGLDKEFSFKAISNKFLLGQK